MGQPYAITRNSRADEDVPGAPVKPDGSPYAYALRFGGGWLYCWSDSVVPLVGALCGDADAYLAGDEQERLVARIRTSVEIQVRLQAQVNVEAQLDGRWAKCTQEEGDVLNGRRDVQPHGWNAGLFGGDVDWWLAPVDLILVSTAYEPYSSVPMPITSGDRLRVIDCVTEEDMLESLMDLGIIALYTHD